LSLVALGTTGWFPMTAPSVGSSPKSRPAHERLAPVPPPADLSALPSTPPASATVSPPARSGRRWPRYLAVVLGLIAIVGGLGFVKFSQISMLMGMGAAMQKAGPPPETVSTRKAEAQTWESTLNAIASAVSAKGVALANDAPGVVARLHFDSGQSVKQGQVLVELDSRVERAQLASVRARLGLANTQLARTNALVNEGVVAKAQVDTDEASFKGAIAEEAQLQAQIDRKIIRAPFTGKLGLRQINLGQYLAPGTTVAILESADSDYVDFTLPQVNLDKLQLGMVVRATQEGVSKEPILGQISAIDPTVDPLTRNMKVRAKFPAQDNPLSPGMFLRVAVVLPEKRTVTAIPTTAVVHASYGDSVFVVEEQPGPDGKPRKASRQRFVRLGDTRGDFMSVVEGVKPGEEVVSSGAFKLRNGIPLIIDNQSVPLKPELAPKPENR
jgi:membrane fusion protein (multidrug efflux system)